MKASELILDLAESIRRHGDRDVMVRPSWSDAHVPIVVCWGSPDHLCIVPDDMTDQATAYRDRVAELETDLAEALAQNEQRDTIPVPAPEAPCAAE